MDLIKIIGGMAESALDAVPGGAAKVLIQRALARRRKVAFEILLQELRRGEGPLFPTDDIMSVVR